jgi:hypothetical protein
MNKKILAALGLGAFALAVGMNLKHAADNYGILYNNLAVQIVAQGNSSGGGGSDDGGASNGGGSSNLILTHYVNSQNDIYKAVETIPVSIENLNKGYFSEIFDSVKYIPLETTDDILIANITKIHYVDNRFFIYDKQTMSVFAFDEQGHCVWKIQNKGNGPREYTQLLGFDVDKNSRKIYLYCRLDKILVYDWDGKFIEEYRIRLDGTSFGVMNDLMYLYTYHRPNQQDEKLFKNNLLIINKDKIQKAFLPYKKRLGKAFLYESPNAFYKYDNELRLYMPFSTKIYSIKGEDLYVRYFFDFGNNNIPDSHLENSDNPKAIETTNSVYALNTYWENRNYCAFSVHYQETNRFQILFDKRTKEIRDGGYDDLAYCFSRIYEATDEYAVGFRYAFELFGESRNSNPQKDKSLLMEVVKKIEEDSNPVVFIYYFKK